MQILIDIGHPGHVHLFRPFTQKMISKGHKVFFTCREKEFEKELLNNSGFDYVSFGKKYKKPIGKIFGLLKFDLQEIFYGYKFKADIFLSHGSPYAAHASFFLRKPHIALEDTGNKEQVRIYMPFTKTILTSQSFHLNYGTKQIRYHGFHELAYLHPKYFVPRPSILEELGIEKNEKYFFVRFISWDASHDLGENGLNWTEKIEIINLLKSKGRVFISSEKELPAELTQFKFNLHPSKVHDAMKYATLFIGEGATMASECAILGTPAVYINSMEAGTINEQEKLGLVYHFRNGEGVIKKINELLVNSNLKENAQLKSDILIKSNIDLTAFLVWFVENYPESIQIIKNNPQYQYNFK